MSERTFTATVVESSRELTTREKLKAKDLSDAVKLDEATQQEAEVLITPDFWVTLNIHNEKSKNNADYINYVIVDVNGEKYVTGSPSFWESFQNIVVELDEAGELENPFTIKVVRRPSKNYANKDFITCAFYS